MAGAQQAVFDQLVERHAGRVFRVCRSILGDEHLGSDASQETFVKLWNRIQVDRIPEHLQAWLGRVAVSTSLDLVRKQRLRAVSEETEPSAAPRASRPVDRAQLHELREELARAMDDLPAGQRTVFALRHEGGLSLREVADLLEIALPTVKTQFARACLKLQARLARFAPDPDEKSR